MSRSEEFTSGCHGVSCYGIRCKTCGHRQTVNGVAPVSSRRLSMKDPTYPVKELWGRHKAKQAGRKGI